MTPEKWQQIKNILELVAEKPPCEQSLILNKTCGDDTELRREVESLLEHYNREETILSKGVAKVAAHLLERQRDGDTGLNSGAPSPLTEQKDEQLIGKVLDGQYLIEAILGQGGMGIIYRARHTLLNKLIAIKVLRPHLSQNPEYKKLLMREGRAMTLFSHPNIVAVHDLRESSDGILYIVLEYIEGHTLKEELKKRQRFTPLEALEILTPIASALSAAHAIGVVHRDLKPGNIIVGKTVDGVSTVKLLDLGIAKFLKREGKGRTGMLSMTATGLAVGTPKYMSPEQWDGREIDERSDIYSLGLIFYELVNGRLPEELTYPERFIMWMDEFQIQPLHTVLQDIPEEFSLAVARATAKRREDRYSNCQEMIDALKKSLSVSDYVSEDLESDIVTAAERLYAAFSRAERRGCERKRIETLAREIARRLLSI